MEAIIFIILQIFYAMYTVLKIGEYPWIFPSFSWGVFARMTCFFFCPFPFQIANAIPLLTQSDLDKAIEILDRSQHLNSLRILLSLPNGVTDSTTQQKTGAVNSLMKPPSNPKVGSLFGNGSKPFYVRQRFCNVQNYM